MSSKGIAGFNSGLVKSAGNSYTPTEWATGDVITAEKLNHMETGIEDSSIIVVKALPSTGEYASILDMKWNEIYDLFINGHLNFIDLYFSGTDFTRVRITRVFEGDGKYVVIGIYVIGDVSTPATVSWFCTSDNDYPYIIDD